MDNLKANTDAYRTDEAIEKCPNYGLYPNEKKNGILIISSHNIKSPFFSSYYLKERKIWMIKNMPKAFKEKSYVFDLKMWTFYSSPRYCLNQIAEAGFTHIETIVFRHSSNKFFDAFLSPFNHYVFSKQEKG